MSSEYPSIETLNALRQWPMEDANGALDRLKSEWHWPDFGVSETLRPEEAAVLDASEGDRFLRLATGGWSGNESLVYAFRYSLAYILVWQLHARGGLWIFKYHQ